MLEDKLHRRLYNHYVSTHTSHLYGEATIKGIETHFPVWEWYYGRFLPQDKSAKILDAGCGNGGFLLWLQEMGYVDASGVDISSQQVELAKRLGAKRVEEADFLECLKDKKELYDLIFARDAIEHFGKDEVYRATKIFYNALKEGECVVIYTPNAESPFGSRLRYGDLTHEVSFTKESLGQMLRTVGFTEITFYSTGPVPKGIKSAVRFLLWKVIETIIRFYMLVETGSSDGIYTQTIICVAKK